MSIIKLKKSSTPGSVPTTSHLEDGEVAINVADQVLYARSGQTIVPVANFSTGGTGTTPTTGVTEDDVFLQVLIFG